MKTILIGLLALSSVFASETIVLEKTNFYTNHAFSTSFEINAELGRAWVEVFSQNTTGPRRDVGFGNTQRVQVPGLSYADGEILYTKGEEVVVCATTEPRGRWIFRHTAILPTGNCEFEQEIVTEAYDDGFHVRNRRSLEIRLVIH